MTANSPQAIGRRVTEGTLTWRGPALMLFARSALALVAQGITAGVFALGGSSRPWPDSEAWLPVYGTLIDAGCLFLLWRLTRREGIRLRDLVGLDRSRLGRDLLLGLVLVPASLLFIFAGVYSAGWLVYGTLTPPLVFGDLPLWASLYGLLVWPWLWGLTEQLTYNGYLLPRFQALSGTGVALVLVVLVWSGQHAVMPMTFRGPFMLYRLLASIPNTLFQTLLYLRLRRIIPFALAHALMDGATVLLPYL